MTPFSTFNTTFYKQDEYDIWDAIKDWSSYHFICIMKDNTIQRFIGSLDENYIGEISQHLDCITSDDYDSYDINYWCEIDKTLLGF